MKRPCHFETSRRTFALSGCQKIRARTTEEKLLAALSELVVLRFEKNSGQVDVVVLVPRFDVEQEASQVSLPAHPACAEFADSDYWLESWVAHGVAWQENPEVYWSCCKFGKRCALVPVIWEECCVAVCRLVCPDSMGEGEFQVRADLLDVLVENFVLREEQLLQGLTCAWQADHRRKPEVSAASAVQPRRETHPKVREAIRYICQHLTDPYLTVTRTASDLGMSCAYLAHLFRGQTGTRMSRYISSIRVERAKDLLVRTDWQIKRVAMESGYANARWFSAVFRAHTGLTPSRFRLVLSGQ